VLADTVLANKRMTVTATISDVRIPRDGTAEIHFNSPNVDGYENIKDRSLDLHCPGTVTLGMARADALKIGKLHTLVISGEPEFRPGSGDVLGDALFGGGGLMQVTIRGDVYRLGTLWLQNAQYKVVMRQ